MAISNRLKNFLDGAKIRYSVASHPVAYTAQEIAAASHVRGRQLAKSVLVKTDHGLTLAVLSAIYLIDLKKLKAALRAKKVSIAKESDIKAIFPDVEVGAMSPFGNIYQVPVIVDKALEGPDSIVFNGGTHKEPVKCLFRAFANAVKPQSGEFALIPKPKPGKKVKKKSKSAKKPAKQTAKKAAKRPKARKR